MTNTQREIKAWAVVGIVGGMPEDLTQFSEGELAIFYDRNYGIEFINKVTDGQGNKIWSLVPVKIIITTP